MQTLQKNEATWYGVLRHYDAGFDTALRVFVRSKQRHTKRFVSTRR